MAKAAKSASQVAWGAEDLTKGGGGIQEGDVQFSNCRFERTDYDGNLDNEITVFATDLTEEDGQEWSENYSVGHDDLRPSDDGEEEAESGPLLVNVGDAKGVNSRSKFGMFVASLGVAGFPSDKFDGNASSLDGMRAHVLRQDIEYKGVKGKGKGKEKQDIKSSVLIVTEILKFPWEEPDQKGKGKVEGKKDAKVKEKAKAKEEDEPEVEAGEEEDPIATEAMEFLLGVLEEKGGKVSKAALAGIAFTKLKGNPNRNKIVTLITSKAFLEGEDVPWNFSGGTITNAE